MSPFGQYPCFFLPMPKIPSDFGHWECLFFVLCPKSQDFLNFSQKKQRFLGTGEKKRLIYPISSSEPPPPIHPKRENMQKKAARQTRFPVCRAAALLSYSVSRRLPPLARGLPPYSQAPARQLFCRRSLLCLRSSSSSAFSVGDPEYDLIAVDLKRQLLTL